MKFYDCYKKMERYILWVAILVIGSSLVVSIHKVEHIDATHDIILAKMKYDEEHHNEAVAEHKAFIQHNVDQDKRMEQMIKVYRDDLVQHKIEDKAVEKRLHKLELRMAELHKYAH